MKQPNASFFTLISANILPNSADSPEISTRMPPLFGPLRSSGQQKRRLAAKVEREKLVIAALTELAVQIIDHARNHGRVTIGDMIRVTGTSRNTLKEHFRRLVEQGHLVRHGTGKGSWYALP